MDSTIQTLSTNLNIRKTCPPPFFVYCSTVFDSKSMKCLSNVSFQLDPAIGLIIKTVQSDSSDTDIKDNDLDLKGKFVMLGFVDAPPFIWWGW